eukprot:c8263_g1_i1.p1 GENE.c8263_g1_i1~~c8263_g1_i1.p1  ORF type:complete len:139 (+),score=5.01 c8263_g1_i1:20-436(+)
MKRKNPPVDDVEINDNDNDDKNDEANDLDDDNDEDDNKKATNGRILPPFPSAAIYPMARVKRIAKMDADIGQIGAEATYVLSKAAELFTEYLAYQASENAKLDDRKSIAYRDLAKCVKENNSLQFLDDIVPEKKKEKK